MNSIVEMNLESIYKTTEYTFAEDLSTGIILVETR